LLPPSPTPLTPKLYYNSAKFIQLTIVTLVILIIMCFGKRQGGTRVGAGRSPNTANSKKGVGFFSKELNTVRVCVSVWEHKNKDKSAYQ